MAENKTQETDSSVDDFLDGIEDEGVREDCEKLIEIFEKIIKAPPKIWGPSIIGFGKYHYKSAAGREGDWMLSGFSPRKKNLSLYVTCNLDEFPEFLEKLGKFKRGKGCLNVKRLEDIHLPTLKKMIRKSIQELKAAEPK
jgi:hypothetical protein